MNRLIGIETEYGIQVQGKDPSDLIMETVGLLRSFPGRFGAPWNYGPEDPRKDMRGFRAERLLTNPEDMKYEKHAARPASPREERSDRVLTNGARLYNDHGHPEYSTPECWYLRDLVAHDRAGERIVLDCARRYSETTGARVDIYKNNTDFHGMSYGTHENYLVPRALPYERLQAAMIPFLVTRQIFAGAGKVGAETRGGGEVVFFQLSQRSEFFTELASVDTLHRRPIMNTRDEPHANPLAFRRLHVIVGDANLSEWATAMKVGTTSVALALIEDGWMPPFALQDPITAISWISRDPSLCWNVPLADGRTISAIDIQRAYLDAARARFGYPLDELGWTLDEWEFALDALVDDPFELEDRADWAAKRALLERFMMSEGVQWDDPLLRSLDLEYSNLDPENGLFQGLEQSGEMRRVVTDDAIERACYEPPLNTRAFIRGLCVDRFHESIQSICWRGVSLTQGGETYHIDLADRMGPEVAHLNQELLRTEDIADFVAALRKPSGGGDHDSRCE